MESFEEWKKKKKNVGVESQNNSNESWKTDPLSSYDNWKKAKSNGIDVMNVAHNRNLQTLENERLNNDQESMRQLDLQEMEPRVTQPKPVDQVEHEQISFGQKAKRVGIGQGEVILKGFTEGFKNMGTGLKSMGRQMTTDREENRIGVSDMIMPGVSKLPGLGSSVEYAGKKIESAGGYLKNKLVDESKIPQEYLEPLIQESGIVNPLLRPDIYLAKFNEVTAGMAMGLTASVATKSPVPMMAVMGFQEKGSAFDDYAESTARELNKDVKELTPEEIDKADVLSTYYGIGSALLETAPFIKFMKGVGKEEAKSILKRGLKNIPIQMLEEGLTEGSQQFSQNLLAVLGGVDNRKLSEGVAESAFTGAVVGAPFGAVQSIRRGEQTNQIKDSSINLPEVPPDGGGLSEEPPQQNDKNKKVADIIIALQDNNTKFVEDNISNLSKNELKRLYDVFDQASKIGAMPEAEEDKKYIEKILQEREDALGQTTGEILVKKDTGNLENPIENVHPEDISSINEKLEEIKQKTGQELPKVTATVLPEFKQAQEVIKGTQFENMTPEEFAKELPEKTRELQSKRLDLVISKDDLLAKKKLSTTPEEKKSIQIQIDEIDRMSKELRNEDNLYSTLREHRRVIERQNLINEIMKYDPSFDISQTAEGENESIYKAWGEGNYKSYLEKVKTKEETTLKSQSIKPSEVEYTGKKPLPYRVEYKKDGHTLHRNFSSEKEAKKWLEKRSITKKQVEPETKIKTARDAAKDMIEYYVKRGDPLEDLMSGQGGAYTDEYHVNIGGYLDGKKIGRDRISVSELNGKEVREIFKLKELYDEIRKENGIDDKKQDTSIELVPDFIEETKKLKKEVDKKKSTYVEFESSKTYKNTMNRNGDNWKKSGRNNFTDYRDDNTVVDQEADKRAKEQVKKLQSKPTIKKIKVETAINGVKSVISKKPSLPILANVKVENGKMYATNLEVAIVLDTKLGDGMYIPIGKEFISTEMDMSDFPEVPSIKDTEKIIKVDRDELIDIFQKSSTFISKEEYKHELQGIEIQSEKDSTSFHATDAYSLIISKVKSKVFNNIESVIVPNSAIISKAIKSLEGELTIKITKDKDESGFIVIQGDNGYVMSRLTVGKYPDIKQIAPRFKKQIVINRKELESAVKSLNPIVKVIGAPDIILENKNGKLSMTVSGGESKLKKTIELSVKENKVSSDGLREGVIIMPIRHTEEDWRISNKFLENAIKSLDKSDEIYLSISEDNLNPMHFANKNVMDKKKETKKTDSEVISKMYMLSDRQLEDGMSVSGVKRMIAQFRKNLDPSINRRLLMDINSSVIFNNLDDILGAVGGHDSRTGIMSIASGWSRELTEEAIYHEPLHFGWLLMSDAERQNAVAYYSSRSEQENRETMGKSSVDGSWRYDKYTRVFKKHLGKNYRKNQLFKEYMAQELAVTEASREAIKENNRGGQTAIQKSWVQYLIDFIHAFVNLSNRVLYKIIRKSFTGKVSRLSALDIFKEFYKNDSKLSSRIARFEKFDNAKRSWIKDDSGFKNIEEIKQYLRDSKGLSAGDIMKRYPDIQLKRDVPITDIHGNKIVIPEGESLTPYELKGNKILLQDGETYIVSKNQFQNIKGQSVVAEGKEFAPELKETEETVLGEKQRFLTTEEEAELGELNQMSDTEINQEGLSERFQELSNIQDDRGNITKYSQYTLPGGKNYKEILIKAPMGNSKPIDLEARREERLKEIEDEFEKEGFTIEQEMGGDVIVLDGNQDFVEDVPNHLRGIGLEYEELVSYDTPPAPKGSFKSSHWDELNVISHLRMNERTYKGNKVAFMEELQSDWAREGRQRGFDQVPTNPEKLLPKGWKVESNGDTFWIVDNNGNKVKNKLGEGEAYGGSKNVAIGKAVGENKLMGDYKPGVPNNPLLKKWQELSVKRALKEAVDSGAEYFSWINGEQTSNRYNLATHVKDVKWYISAKGDTLGKKYIKIMPKSGSNVINFYIDKKGVISEGVSSWNGKTLDEVLGKGLADKIMEKEEGTLSGEGLKFGGEWASNLYDRQVKNIIENLTGGKVEMLDLGLPVDKEVKRMELLEGAKEGDPDWKFYVKGQLTIKDLKVGTMFQINENQYIITDVLGNGKFKAVPKEPIYNVEGFIADLKNGKDAYLKRLALKKKTSLDDAVISKLVADREKFIKTNEETFDISVKKTTQQGIRLTPDIKAIIKGEAPAIKSASGKNPFEQFETNDDMNKQMFREISLADIDKVSKINARSVYMEALREVVKKNEKLSNDYGYKSAYDKKDKGYSDYEELTGENMGGLEHVRPIELPEIIGLIKDLTGKYPQVKKGMRGKLGDAQSGTLRIRVLASLFTQKKIKAGKAVIAHELGHIIDYLPTTTSTGGNILAKIAKFTKYLKEKLPNDPNFSNKQIRGELKALTQLWKPFDDQVNENYTKYRYSSTELYADALSVLFNSPGFLQEKAPQFTKAFFKYLDNKPEVKSEYFAVQELLNGSREEIVKQRQKDLRAGFEKAESRVKKIIDNKKNADKRFTERLRQQLDDVNYPILKRQVELEASGRALEEDNNPAYLLEEVLFSDNDNYLMLEDINDNIIQPLELSGITMEDMGEYLTLTRIMNDRADIANPYGFTPDSAKEQLEYLRDNIGESKYNLMADKLKEFHEIVFKTVEQAVEAGSYNEELFREKIEPNRDTYASFRVVDYIEEYMPATIKKQVGTFKEIANPLTSTILKTVSLNRLNSYQKAKRATIDMLGNEATKSRRITTDGKLSVFKAEKGKGTIEILENGKMQSYDVDPYIAESFNRDSLYSINAVIEAIDLFNGKFFKPIVTTYNMGFALAFNPIRDFKRNYKMIGDATVYGLLKAYIKSLPSAYKYAQGEMDDFTRELVKNKAITAPIYDYNFDPREDEFGKIMERYGLIKTDERFKKLPPIVRKTVVKGIIKLLEFMRRGANTLEITSKIAGAKIRMSAGESGKKLSYNLRNYTGTPNWTRKGTSTKTTNALFVFSNIMKEGLKSDYQIATSPNTRKGYWWKTMKIDFLPKIAMFAAQAGLLGLLLGKKDDDEDDWLKRFYDKVSEYDKTNYIIIPLGIKEDGKAVYMRVPHDETGRLLSAVLWKMMNFAKDRKLESFNQIFSIGAGQLPSITPAISIPAAWVSYLSGKNPYDAFRGRNVIDDTTFNAGGWRSLQKMLQWTTNSLGIFQFATYDTSTNTTVETVFQMTPLLNRLIKISDYGLQEKENAITREQTKESAQKLLEKREIIPQMIKDGKNEVEIIEELKNKFNLSPSDENWKRTITLWRNDISKERVKQATGNQTNRLIKAKTNDEKVRILNSYRKEMDENKYKNYVDSLIEGKVISENVYGRATSGMNKYNLYGN